MVSKRWAWILTGTVAAVLLVAYIFIVQTSQTTPDTSTGKASSTDSASTDEAHLRIGYIPIADCAQLYVADARGYFKEQGITVELLSFAGGAKVLEALGTGSVDVGFAAVAPLIQARAAGLSFVAITGGPAEDSQHIEHAILVADKSPIRKPSDLEGKRIAINTFRSIDDVFTREWLDKNGIDVSGVSLIEIPFPQMEPSLLSDQVDAIVSIEPFVTAARANGKTRVLATPFIDIQDTTEISAYNVDQQWLENNRAVAGRFAAAIAGATNYANDHPEDVKTIVTKYTNIKPEIATEMTLPRFTTELSEERAKFVMDLLIKWDIIKEGIDLSQMIVNLN